VLYSSARHSCSTTTINALAELNAIEKVTSAVMMSSSVVRSHEGCERKNQNVTLNFQDRQKLELFAEP
jgi:hypothetical protein